VAAGANPMLLKRGIELAAQAVADSIRKNSIEVKGHDDIAHVASISAADPTIGDLIAEVMDKVGKDGVITVEESKGRLLKPSMWTACSLSVATSAPTSSPMLKPCRRC
jgi:chaperonin GroEL